MGTYIRMRMYILEFVSNGICMYLYSMGTCIRMRTYNLWVLVFDRCIRMRMYILVMVSYSMGTFKVTDRCLYFQGYDT